MSIVQVVGSGVKASASADRTSFIGARVPKEVKALPKPLAKLDKETFRKLLKMVVAAMEGEEVQHKQIKEIISNGESEESLTAMYTGLYTLLRTALRHPQPSLKMELFKIDLNDLQIPEEFQTDIASVIFGNRRPKIDKHAVAGRPHLPSLDLFRWRVDVAISTSVLNRVLEPTVMMEMTLSNGRIHTFEVPVSKFHELRYNVAYVLKEMEDLEKRSILKIQD
ncbi:COMM domain-containing protein 5-like isoform X1 [Haliotis cracherodii]|uniref:COMM domain-containing protein 5-like isoform X1 n=1 Tax=Haliotis cracherodii TaxID=6455 RepID=UPI0039E7EDA0